ncbi:MAG: hypothetical protein QOE92_943 [Chloroflexota bacterium]|jgi:ferritin-like metal-binding protein YciE|nr:hypothetical protein [Chloroflexota bacterium]
MPDREKQKKMGAQKIVQWLNEAHATELALVQTLTAHISITPRSTYRTGLERHLKETQRHAQKVEARLSKLGEGRNPLQVGLAAAQATVGQVVSMAKAPVDVARGMSAAEKLLKNAKDEATSEQLEIGTYRAIRRLAEATGDTATARLAGEILRQEEAMLVTLHREIDNLVMAVVKEEVRDQEAFDITTVGAVDALRRLTSRAQAEAADAAREGRAAGREAGRAVRRTTKTAATGARATARSAARGARTTARTAASSATRARTQARRAATSTRRAAAPRTRG